MDDPDDTVPIEEEPPLDGDGTFDLVQRARRGDRAALDSLFERYYSRVMTIVRLRMGKGLRLHVESGDIAQNTFYEATKDIDKFEYRGEASLINWLSKIVQHKILEAAARQRPDVPLDGDDSGEQSGLA